MPRQKILILASWYPSAASPVSGIFIQDQAHALLQQYEVAVIAPQIVGWRKIWQGKIGRRSQLQAEDHVLVCRERVLVPVPFVPSLIYRNWLSAIERGFTQLLAQWGKPEVIHAHVVLPGGWAAVRLGKQHAIPVALTEHTSPFCMHLETSWQRHWARETLTQADRVIAVSPALAQQIHAFDDSIAIHVLGNLVKTDFFIPAKNANRQSAKPAARFLSVGLLSEQKGITYLLQAAHQLVQRGLTTFELIIGGDGPERPLLERQAHTLGLAKHCRFTGLLTREEVKQLMQQCDVFVMSSLHETFCLVLGEAMACGKPVIATRCGGPEFVVTPETGVLVEVADPAALANAMCDFILGQVNFDSSRVRQSVVERFGEEAFLRQIAVVYEQIWSKKR